MMRTRHFLAFSLLAVLGPLAGCPLTDSGSPDVSWLSQFSPAPQTSGPTDTNPAAREVTLLADVLATLVDVAGVSVSTSSGPSTNAEPPRGETLLPDGRTVRELVESWNITPPETPVEPPAAPPAPFPPPAPPPQLDSTVFCYAAEITGTNHEVLVGQSEGTTEIAADVRTCYDLETGELRGMRVPGNFVIPAVDLYFETVGERVTVAADIDEASSFELTATLLSRQRVGDVDMVEIDLAMVLYCPPFVVQGAGTQSIRSTRGDSSLEYESVMTHHGSFFNEFELLMSYEQTITLAGTLVLE